MSKKSTTLGEPIEGNEEVFEITDFTCVTDLECFAAALETVIHDWELGGGKSDGVKRKTAENLPKVKQTTRKWLKLNLGLSTNLRMGVPKHQGYVWLENSVPCYSLLPRRTSKLPKDRR